jgi:hypothetical protein
MRVPFGPRPLLPSDDELRQSLDEFWALRIAVEAADRAAAALESDPQSAPAAPSSPYGENVRVLYLDGPPVPAGPDCPRSAQEARILNSSIFLPFCS